MRKSKIVSVGALILIVGVGLYGCGESDEPPLNADFPSGPQYGEYIDLPGADGSADPHIIEVDGAWYLYPTTTGVSIECWRSSDFENWEYEGVVWGPAPAGSWNDGGVWAPDVFAHEGQFYLYYTANDKIGVAVADSPVGPFEDVYDHPLIGGGYGGEMQDAIDAHMFRDQDGRLYLYTTGTFGPLRFQRVFPMLDPWTVEGPWKLLFVTNLLSWEMFVNEGAWMILRNGVYYLMYSGNGANLPLYGLGYATAESPTGPFTKYEQNPILRMDPDHDFYGPGHNSVTTGPDGKLWMFYHTKVNERVNYDRLIRKNKIAFTEDGQLYVDVGLGPPSPLQQ